MIDIHCHILPGIDDGSNSLGKTLEMLKIAEKDGTDKIVATPHFHYKSDNNNFADIEKQVEQLNKIIIKKFMIKIMPGQEIYLDKSLLNNYRKGLIKGLNNTRYMLLELPMKNYPEYAIDLLYELRIMGIIPIIAHPERYKYFSEHLTLINEFIEEGCLFQMNAGSLEGKFGYLTQKITKKLIKNRIYDFIASDAHGVTNRRPQIQKNLEQVKKLDFGLAEKFLMNSELLLNNAVIVKQCEKIRERRTFIFFSG